MKLYFNMTVPLWLPLLLFIILGGLTVLLYRRHKLPRPWKFWLPGLRLAAIGLLLLTLLQPVLVKTYETLEPGHIAVLVDNSGSMSISDDYTVPEQVDIAWHMQLYPQKHRNHVFAEQAETLVTLGPKLEQLHAALKGYHTAVNGGDENKSEKAGKELKKQFKETVAAVADLRETIADSVADFDYLKPKKKEKKKEKKKKEKPKVAPRPPAIPGPYATNLARGWTFVTDPRNQGEAGKWFDPAYDASRWKTIRVDTTWEKQGYQNYDGVGWYRTRFTVPANLKGRRLYLHFAGVDEDPRVWVNGKFVGERRGPHFWDKPWRIEISAAVKWGAANDLIIRVYDSAFAGGIYKAVTLTDLLEKKKPKTRKKPPEKKTGRGWLTHKRWLGITGWQVASLTGSPKFNQPPNTTELLGAFTVPGNAGDSFGSLVHGYVHPPQTGNYIFMLCADDEGQLFLSTSASPADKKLIAHAIEWTPINVFNKFPSQKSQPIRLEADRAYYVEAIFKENLGDDHLIVGWQRPDGKTEIPIPGRFLSPVRGEIISKISQPFRLLYDRFQKPLERVETELKKMRKDFAELARKKTAKEKLPAILSQQQRLGKLNAELVRAAVPYAGLQEAADLELAGAGIKEVDEALARFRKMKRHECVKFILTEEPYELLEKLDDRGLTQLFTLGDEFRELPRDELDKLKSDWPQTPLGTRQSDILKFYENLTVSAIITISDGNNNAGKMLREIKEMARERDIPLLSLGVGAPRPPKDIAIDHVLSPKTSFKNDSLNLSVVLKRDGFTGRQITLKIVSDAQELHRKVLPPGPETRITVDMSFVEKRNGILQYQVEAESFATEALAHNNHKLFTVNVLKDPIKTLLIDEFPRWESRYCNMMLKRDPRINLHSIFVASMDQGRLKSGEEGWPESRDALFAYQILVMGDVNPRHFTREQLEDIKRFVIERGGTVIFMAGEHHMPGKYLATPLTELFPVHIRDRVGADRGRAGEQGSPDGTGTARGKFPQYKLEITEESRYDGIVQLSSTPEMSARLWRELPAMNWVKKDVVASRVADCLVNTQERPWPVMLKANIGLGKVMYLGSDSFWRWRYRARWTYHHRFWGQVLLWATLGRTTGTDKYVKLMTSRPEYTPGETVEIKARLLDERELPIKNATASAEVYDQAAGLIKKIVELKYLRNSGGRYTGQIRDLPRGKYRIIPRVKELKDKKVEAEAYFEIRDLPTSEYVELALNAPMLKSFTSFYRHFHLAGEIIDQTPKLEVKRKHREEKELWDSFFVIILAALLLGFEWYLRKRNQLV